MSIGVDSRVRTTEERTLTETRGCTGTVIEHVRQFEDTDVWLVRWTNEDTGGYGNYEMECLTAHLIEVDEPKNAMPRVAPAIRVTAMPADTNPEGDIFGGWLMSQMDLAAGSVAFRTSQGRAATVAMDGMIFHTPVQVGDEVSFYATLKKVGRTSMTIYVEAWRRQRFADEAFKVTEATFTFVAIDENHKPRPVHA